MIGDISFYYLPFKVFIYRSTQQKVGIQSFYGADTSVTCRPCEVETSHKEQVN
jgi:hypothetical protein